MNILEEYKNKIINADCMEILKQLPDKSIDLVLTDPPYGSGGGEFWETKKKSRFGGRFDKYEIKRTGGKWSNKYGKIIEHWDVAPEKEVFNEIFRVSKNQIIWGGNYFALPATRCFLVWDKLTISENFSMAMCEYAWTSFHKNAKRFEMAPQDKFRFHPTQKPLKLIEWCVLNYSQENDLILDCFSGSGTTAIACFNLKRNFICVEKDFNYFSQSLECLNDVKAQLKLF